MICSACHQNEAELLFKQIVNNHVTQNALCRDCAQKLPLAPAAADAFLQLLGGLGLMPGERRPAAAALRCSACGLSWGRFQETGRLGCAECYRAFREPLADLLPRIHGSGAHGGKHPKGTESKNRPEKKKELQKLQDSLAAAVQHERFEEAAAIRDKIHRLQS